MSRVLVCEDDSISRGLLGEILARAGYDVVATERGEQALAALCRPEAPHIAILDWVMPPPDGIEICRTLRQDPAHGYVYVILVTGRDSRDDLARAFDAGADDYLTKPFDPHELRARVAVGKRLVDLQRALRAKVEELEVTLSQVQQLQGLLPICMHCKRIRDDGAHWHRLETFIQNRSQAMFTHSLCDECLGRHYPSVEQRIGARQKT